jgi:N-acetylneuraminate synthase
LATEKVVMLHDIPVGKDQPCYIIGEIGINHNGDLEIAKKLIDYAQVFDFQCVKFQKRDPDTCVPEAQKNVLRKTPWGEITYLDYRKKVEFGEEQYREIMEYCADKEIHCSASIWDTLSLEFMLKFDIPFIKIPSALITNNILLQEVASVRKPVIISTGMSTLAEVDHAVNTVLAKNNDLIVCHCHSAYPAPLEELNLRTILFFKERYPECVVGYSGHEFGLDTTVMATVFGAALVERHITIDRTLWGTDQVASVEPQGMYRLPRDIRAINKALGDGKKRVYDSELPAREKLRGS